MKMQNTDYHKLNQFIQRKQSIDLFLIFHSHFRFVLSFLFSFRPLSTALYLSNSVGINSTSSIFWISTSLFCNFPPKFAIIFIKAWYFRFPLCGLIALWIMSSRLIFAGVLRIDCRSASERVQSCAEQVDSTGHFIGFPSVPDRGRDSARVF